MKEKEKKRKDPFELMLICEVLNFALLHSQLLWKPTYLSLGISKLWSCKQTGSLASLTGTMTRIGKIAEILKSIVSNCGQFAMWFNLSTFVKLVGSLPQLHEHLLNDLKSLPLVVYCCKELQEPRMYNHEFEL